MVNETAVVLREHVERDGVDREAEDREALETHRLRRKSGRRTRRLAEVDDRRLRRGSQNSGCSRLAPQCIEDVTRTGAAERLLEGRDEITVLVKSDRCISTKIRSTLEPAGTTTGRDDPTCTKELRGLDGNEAD